MAPDEKNQHQLRYFNVLSLDWGLVGGIFSGEILNRLIENFPKLVRDVDLLVGVGFGAAQAVSLACDEPLLSYTPRNFSREVEKQFGDLRLGELSKRVAIPTIVKSGNAWNLKICHNFVGPDSDSEMLVSEVIKQAFQHSPQLEALGYNPSALALTQAMDPRTGQRGLDDLTMLSIGDVSDGRTRMANFQCKALLLSGYRRITPGTREQEPTSENLKSWAGEIEIEPTLKWLRDEWL